MKSSLIAALVLVLAIVHGTESMSLVKRDAPYDMDQITKLLQDMTTSISNAAKGLAEKVKAHELNTNAQTYIQDSQVQVQPLVDQVQAEALKLHEQVQPILTNIEQEMKPLADNFETKLRPVVDSLQAQIRPLADNLQAQMKPLATDFQAQIEQIFQQAVSQAKAVLPPQ